MAAQPSYDPDLLPRWFRTKFEIRDCGYDTPCWYWVRALGGAGYGQVAPPKKEAPVLGVPYRSHSAHALAHILAGDPRPEGLVIDHLCRVRACCRPDHHEFVTINENGRRARNKSGMCKRGHDLAVTRNSRGTCGQCVYLSKWATYHGVKIDDVPPELWPVRKRRNGGVPHVAAVRPPATAATGETPIAVITRSTDQLPLF